MFNGPDGQKALQEYFHYGCRDAQISPYKYPLDERCLKYVCNVGVSTIGAQSCQCTSFQ